VFVMELLDGSLNFAISIKVRWMGGKDELVAILDSAESVSDKSDLDSTVGGEDSLRVNLVHLKMPVGDCDAASLKIGNVSSWVLGGEIINGFLGEINLSVVSVIRNKEVWEGFLNIAFDVLGLLGSRDFASVVEHGGNELFESRHCILNF